MKTLIIILFMFLTTPVTWLGNYNDATQKAKNEHKLILISFSGSDWCIPCMRLRKEILETEAFEKYAASNLVLVRADFPRQKKNKLSAEQTARNEALAERFNKQGVFPYTVLVNENGKVLKAWDGYPNEKTDEFVSEIAKIKH